MVSNILLFPYFSNTTYAKVAWWHMKLEVGTCSLVEKLWENTIKRIPNTMERCLDSICFFLPSHSYLSSRQNAGTENAFGNRAKDAFKC